MTIKLVLAFAAFSSALLFSSCSSNSYANRGRGQGQHRGGNPAKRSAQSDTNGDKQLSYAEFQKTPLASRGGNTQAAFQRVDTNRDGYLQQNELQAARPTRPQRNQ